MSVRVARTASGSKNPARCDDRRTREIFAACVELTGQARAAYLATACLGDRKVYARVKRLLAAHELATRDGNRG